MITNFERVKIAQCSVTRVSNKKMRTKVLKFYISFLIFVANVSQAAFILDLRPGSIGKIGDKPFGFTPICGNLLASFRSAFEDHWRDPLPRKMLVDQLANYETENADLAFAQEFLRSADNLSELRLALSAEASQLRKTLSKIRNIPNVKKFFAKLKIDQGFIVGVELAHGVDAIQAFKVLEEHSPSIKGVSFSSGFQLTEAVAAHPIFQQLSYIEIKAGAVGAFAGLNGHRNIETLKFDKFRHDLLPDSMPKLTKLIISRIDSLDLFLLGRSGVISQLKSLELQGGGLGPYTVEGLLTYNIALFVARLPFLTQFKTNISVLMEAYLRSEKSAQTEILSGSIPESVGIQWIANQKALSHLNYLNVWFEGDSIIDLSALKGAAFINKLRFFKVQNPLEDVTGFDTLAKTLKGNLVPTQIGFFLVDDLNQLVKSDYSTHIVEVATRLSDPQNFIFAVNNPNFSNFRKLEIFLNTARERDKLNKFPWVELANSQYVQLTELYIDFLGPFSKNDARSGFIQLSKSQNLKDNLITLRLPRSKLSVHEVEVIFKEFLDAGIQITYTTVPDLN